MPAKKVFLTNGLIIRAVCDGFVSKLVKVCQKVWRRYEKARTAACSGFFMSIKLLLGSLTAQYFFGLQVYGALQAFLLQRTAHLIGFLEAAAVAKIIGVAAAAAVKTRPALHAGRLGQDMAGLKIRADFRHGDAFINSADFEFGIADELMAGVEIAFRAYGQIIVARAAAGQTLGQAGAVSQIHIEMEKVIAVASFVVFEVVAGQFIVLRTEYWQIFFLQRVIILGFSDYRFHG